MLLALAINIFSKSANVNDGRHFEIKFCRQLVQCTVSLVQLCAIYARDTTVKRVIHVWVYILYPLVLHDVQSKQTTVNSGICHHKHPFNMSVRTIDFSSSAYAKTKSFKAKENNTTSSRIKEKNPPPSGVKSSWTPLKQDLNEKVCVCLSCHVFFSVVFVLSLLKIL